MEISVGFWGVTDPPFFALEGTGIIDIFGVHFGKHEPYYLPLKSVPQ